jgi:pseudouridine-5'-phosphate glycosidase
VVALESSVFAQGLPHSANKRAAQLMIAAVERSGAVPAITAVVRGIPSVGLGARDLARFLDGDGVAKASARDLAPLIARRGDGATTVAAAIVLAHCAGVAVFATGGIGGVHRDGSDESADLLELSRTPVIVVCSGAKAILDLGATVERLETLGVTVVGYRTDRFPAFYSAATRLPVTVRVESAREVAAIFAAHRALGRPGAVLVVQPPPSGTALSGRSVESAVKRGLEAAAGARVRGPAVTPFLLQAVECATGGRSVAANLALLEQNAGLAGEIAVALRGTVNGR